MTEDAINKVEMMLLTLIEKSEGRIEKTNDMIGKCLSVIDRVSGEYTIQIKKGNYVGFDTAKTQTSIKKRANRVIYWRLRLQKPRFFRNFTL